jgi:hypothetical protein
MNEKTDPYAHITPQAIRDLMSDYNIRGDRAAQKGKLSVRKLAELSGCPYNSLNLAMNGKRSFSEAIKVKLHHFFYVKSMEKQIEDFDK